MAQRGRKPKPSALKELEGNPGKREINTNEPRPVKKAPPCPKWLEPDARKEWRRLAKQMEQIGILTEVDMTAFAGYCQAYARWREAQDEITRHGSIYKDGDGRIRPNPYIAIANQQMREIKSFAADFGLTPSNRTAMIANVLSAAKKRIDPMEAILVSDADAEIETVGGSNFEDSEEWE